MFITNLKPGVKNPNRVNVFVDGKFSFSLDVAQVVDMKLKVGKEISAEDLVEYKKASEFGKLYQRALEWVLVRPRSEKETRDYLYRKLKMSSSGRSSRPSSRGSSLRPRSDCGCPSEDGFEFSDGLSPRPVGRENSSEDMSELSNQILKRLISKGYVDDRKFAEYYVENRFVKKGISRKRLAMELMKKGVVNDVIDEVLGKRNDEEEILKIIAKKRNKYDDEKLIAYLCRQGFAYDLVRELVKSD